MKKLVLIALSVALCFPAAFATADTQLYGQGLAMVSLLAEMAQNPLMLSLATASEEIEELVGRVAQGDYESPPSQVFQLTLSQQSIDEFLSLMVQEGETGSPSEALEREISKKVRATLPSQINARNGAAYIAAAAILTANQAFVGNPLEEDIFYVYFYPDAFPVIVFFSPGQDGAIQTTGTYLLAETPEDVSAAALEEMFALPQEMDGGLSFEPLSDAVLN